MSWRFFPTSIHDGSYKYMYMYINHQLPFFLWRIRKVIFDGFVDWNFLPQSTQTAIDWDMQPSDRMKLCVLEGGRSSYGRALLTGWSLHPHRHHQLGSGLDPAEKEKPVSELDPTLEKLRLRVFSGLSLTLYLSGISARVFVWLTFVPFTTCVLFLCLSVFEKFSRIEKLLSNQS